MALSDTEIIEARKSGDILIEPYNESHLATSSYDVTLGEWYFRERKPANHLYIYDLYDKEHTDRVWGTEASRAESAKNVFPGMKFKGLKPEDKVILIHPGETILAHTNEFIGGKNTITTMMKARSSLGRNFIEVCKCAGWGDVGYTNRWTMEITNNSKNYAIPLVVGMRVAQIIFFRTGPIRGLDYTSIKTSKYQTERDIDKLTETWSAEMMLPKLYRDRTPERHKKIQKR